MSTEQAPQDPALRSLDSLDAYSGYCTGCGEPLAADVATPRGQGRAYPFVLVLHSCSGKPESRLNWWRTIHA